MKLVVDEGDHAPVREFYNSNPNCHATSLCLMEALGVLKGKWTQKRLSHTEYLKATEKLVIDAWGKKIRPDNVDLFTPEGLNAVKALAAKHSLDVSDALQLETILHGTYQYFARDSKPILITADQKLRRLHEAKEFELGIASRKGNRLRPNKQFHATVLALRARPARELRRSPNLT